MAAASLPERSLRNSPFLTNYYQFVKLLSENRFFRSFMPFVDAKLG